MDVYQYFSASCYKGFGDDEGGFYHVYRDIFHQIATEDLEFMDDEDEFDKIPKFGDSTSDYETVVGPFYGYWQSYSTKKSYSWLCQHNINEIRDRRILREIEKETKKLAQKARKDRNEEVRALVSFVRKRDKRVQQYKLVLEVKAEQNRIKQDQKRLEQIRKNRLEVEQMASSTVFNVDGYEEMIRQMEKSYRSSDEDDYDDEDSEDVGDVVNGTDLDNVDTAEEEEYVDHLYCVACNKSFKNESSYKNHETSKKHLSNIERLKREMLKEDADYKINESLDDNIDSDENDDVDRVETVKKSKKSKKKNRVIVQAEQEHEEIENVVNDKEDKEDKEDEKIETIEKPRKSAKAKRLKKNEQSSNATHSVGPSAESKVNVTDDIAHNCVTCKSTFDSKNKLFAHLKKTNHGVYIPKETTAAPSTNTKKGKHRK